MIQPSDIIEDTIEIVNAASQFILENVGKVSKKDIETKELNSLVSYVDKGAEEIIVQGLRALTPEAGYITEEDTINEESKDWTWIIDPLDGTTNFLMGIPHFAVSVALMHKNEIVLGIVKEVSSGEMFHAVKGEGAYLNYNPISVTSSPIDEVIVATGFPYSNNYDTRKYIARLEEILTAARGLRRMGSAALDLCYVACGRFGAYYETSINPWDVAAGQLIVLEAGGFISDFKGNEGYNDGSFILACQKNLSVQMIDFLKD